MEWQDEGLVLSCRRHGERDAILEVMTRDHGRHFGLVRSGRSPKQAPTLQPGNRLALTWRARLEDHLGTFTAELLQSRAGAVFSKSAILHAVSHLAILLRLMPERAPHTDVYGAADGLCGLFDEPRLLGAMLIRFELMLLDELGFGLDLEKCAATGSTAELIYVSPKSGRAVSREAGAPWETKLLTLPGFLKGAFTLPATGVSDAELEAGFHLTGFFLDRHVFEPRGQGPSSARSQFVSELLHPEKPREGAH